MKIANLQKESSERSDAKNWAKNLLIEKTTYFFESIEGCSQNADNVVTHLFERARFDSNSAQKTIEEVRSMIVALESAAVLKRKLNFSKLFGIPLSYVLYCNETENVFLFKFESLEKFELVEEFSSYQAFSNWIALIKGWTSKKIFRENNDLPYFDQQLRKHKTAWPTNLDCFFTDENNVPIGIIEYQNADRVGVANHCNNDYLLCKISFKNASGYTDYHDDIRRWTSQEIIRVQSALRFFIITWSTISEDYILKEIEKIALPYFRNNANGSRDWAFSNRYKAAMNKYSNTKNDATKLIVANEGMTVIFVRTLLNQINVTTNVPPLSLEKQTFPHLYYSSKSLTQGNKNQLIDEFTALI